MESGRGGGVPDFGGSDQTVAPVQRRQILALDAARLGDAELASWFGSADVPGQPDPEPGLECDPAWASGSAADPRFLRAFAGHGGPVTAVTTAVVGGRTVAVAGSRDGEMRVWDLTTGSPRHELIAGRTDPVSSMAAELPMTRSSQGIEPPSDPERFIFRASSRAGRRWNVKRGRRTTLPRHRRGPRLPQYTIRILAVCSTSCRICSTRSATPQDGRRSSRPLAA